MQILRGSHVLLWDGDTSLLPGDKMSEQTVGQVTADY